MRRGQEEESQGISFVSSPGTGTNNSGWYFVGRRRSWARDGRRGLAGQAQVRLGHEELTAVAASPGGQHCGPGGARPASSPQSNCEGLGEAGSAVGYQRWIDGA